MLRLMIVDDEQIIRETLSEMIDYEAIGYELIAVAKNGMEAYDIICDEYPDVVITDIRMPILNGLELIKRSIKSDSQITFILLSGYSEFEYAKQAMRCGVRHYLLKPTDKQELIDTLISIKEELQREKELKKEEQRNLLCHIHSPLEQCFIMESLETGEDFSSVFRKYQPLLSLTESPHCACICSFVEEPYLDKFITDMNTLFLEQNITLKFSVIYVKNSVVLIFSELNSILQNQIRKSFDQLRYDGQSVAFQSRFLNAKTSEELFQRIIIKISRYERILLLDNNGERIELRNNIAAPWRINRIGESISTSSDPSQAVDVLDSILADTLPLDTARNIALGLFLNLNSEQENQSLDIVCDFFRKLYSCPDIQNIRELMSGILLQEKTEPTASKTNENIALLKAYVNQHLDAENLSLKWLAENYLFVSVGYLSKQFIKKEGMRFSDYLNTKRMEEAERLMLYHHNENIKSIACQVGFGNNPHYFSQVFKRYTGFTPTEYIDNIKN